MTKEIKINLNTIVDVRTCSQLASNCPRNISIKAKHDEFVVDARSLLGLFSLNLSNDITLVFTSNLENDSRLDDCIKMFNNLMVKENKNC